MQLGIGGHATVWHRRRDNPAEPDHKAVRELKSQGDLAAIILVCVWPVPSICGYSDKKRRRETIVFGLFRAFSTR
jgi:hypothetical protein